MGETFNPGQRVTVKWSDRSEPGTINRRLRMSPNGYWLWSVKLDSDWTAPYVISEPCLAPLNEGKL